MIGVLGFFDLAVVGVERKLAVAVVGNIDFRLLLSNGKLLCRFKKKMHFLAVGVALATNTLAAPAATHSAASTHAPSSTGPSASSHTSASASAGLPAIVGSARLLQFLGGVVALVEIQAPSSRQDFGSRHIRCRC